MKRLKKKQIENKDTNNFFHTSSPFIFYPFFSKQIKEP